MELAADSICEQVVIAIIKPDCSQIKFCAVKWKLTSSCFVLDFTFNEAFKKIGSTRKTSFAVFMFPSDLYDQIYTLIQFKFSWAYAFKTYNLSSVNADSAFKQLFSSFLMLLNILESNNFCMSHAVLVIPIKILRSLDR